MPNIKTHSEVAEYISTLRIPTTLVNSILDFIAGGTYPAPEAIEVVNQSSDTSPPVTSGFKLGAASRKELQGVKPELVRIVERAIQITTQDFCVFDGIRTVKEQQEYVRKGTSKTMKSKHLEGLAVDLVPWVSGKPVWDWERIYAIVCAMDQAATELGYADKIRWGGAWDRVLSDFGGDTEAYRNEVKAYSYRHPGKDFIDGPHFEWVD